MAEYDLTIISPIKSAGSFLAPHVERLVALASLPNTQILIIDNNEDESELAEVRRLAEAYINSGIRLEKNERDLGVHGSLQKALDLTQTPYVTYVAADDILLPEYVVEAPKILASCPSVSVVWGRQYFVDVASQDAPAERKNPFPLDVSGKVSGNSLRALLCNFPVDTGLIARTNEVRHVGGFKNHGWFFELQEWGDGYVLDVDHFVNGKHPHQESKKMYSNKAQVTIEGKFFSYIENRCEDLYGPAGMIAAKLFNSGRLQGGQFLAVLESFICSQAGRSWSAIKEDAYAMQQLVTVYVSLILYECFEEHGRFTYKSSMASTGKNPPQDIGTQIDALFSVSKNIGALDTFASPVSLRNHLFC